MAFSCLQDITEGGSIKNCICEMKAMLNSPIKAFVRPGTEQPLGSPISSPGVDTSDSIQEGDIPGQFTRLMAKGNNSEHLFSTYRTCGLRRQSNFKLYSQRYSHMMNIQR